MCIIFTGARIQFVNILCFLYCTRHCVEEVLKIMVEDLQTKSNSPEVGHDKPEEPVLNEL